jgi:diguanylate cyclase (GGDEF)-like protein
VVLPDCKSTDLLDVAERIRRRLARSPTVVGEVLVPVTASIGASWVQGGCQSDRLVQVADEALYEAKHAGRNRVRYRALKRTDPFKAVG